LFFIAGFYSYTSTIGVFFSRSLKECFLRDLHLADFYSRRIIILTYTRLHQYKSSVLLFDDACLCGRRRRNSISTLTHRQGRTTAPSLSPMPVLSGYDKVDERGERNTKRSAAPTRASADWAITILYIVLLENWAEWR